MNPAPPRFVVVDEPGPAPGLPEFLRAVGKRIDRKVLGIALVILLAAQLHIHIAHLGQMRLGAFRIAPLPDLWKIELLVHAVFIVCIVLAVLAADEAVARGARRWTTYLAALLLACAVAAWAQAGLVGAFGWVGIAGLPPAIRTMVPYSLFFTGLLYAALGCFVYVNERTARLAADRMRAAELARAQARRRTLESRLQEMQARVEPQFLFNTLAQVKELYEREPGVAGQMLDDLIAYLRAALPHLRESSSTIGREVELARAYLDIMRVRLGQRLAVEIELPEALLHARMPAMMLLPLIDHALVHGLRPGDLQGSIRIETSAEGGVLTLRITDGGAGFVRGIDSAGLTSVAERLEAIYGSAARFELARIDTRTTCATLELPLEATDLRDR